MKIKVVDNISIKSVDLRKLRQSTGLSLKEFAKASGINWAYLSIMERGDIKLVGYAVWQKFKTTVDKELKKQSKAK